MPPNGLAILIGAGPNTGTGIARILTHPSHGNLAIALLARSQENLSSVKKNIQSTNSGAIVETFSTDTSPESITKTFAAINSHGSFAGLKLKVAIYSVKHASKKDFLEETYQEFTKSLTDYVGGAFIFAQETLKRFFADHGEGEISADAVSSSSGSDSGGATKGTLIFTGTLAALRTTTAQYASYSAGRAGVRLLAQGLAKDYSSKGIHVVHAIANGKIEDKDGEDQVVGKSMSADAVGKEYWRLSCQEPCLWTHELDMRPAQEKF